MALTLTFGSLLEVHLGDYATGDGITDDAAGIAAAIADAGGTQTLVAQPGKTYLVGSTVAIGSALRWEGNGATIKRTVGLNGRALSVTGADVEISELSIDGNLSGGNANAFGCIQWTGARGVARRVKATNSARQGFLVTGAGAVLDAYECEASSHVSGAGAGDGFLAQSGGLLRTYNCRGDNNDRTGFFFLNGCAAGCRLDGTANNNLFSGCYIKSDGGVGGRFLTSNNKNYGVYALGSATAANWAFGYVEDDDCGQALNGEYTPNPSASGISLQGVVNFHFDSVVVRRPLGYGVSVVRDAGTSTGTTGASFGDVRVESAGDPAFHISGSSQRTTVSSLTAKSCTMPVSFGEGVPGNANDHNVFDFIHAIACTYAVVNCEAGSRNTFGRIKATDCINNSPYVSFIRFNGAGTACDKNTVHSWESDNPGSTPAAYIVACDASATNNRILSGCARDYGTAVLSDANGTNSVSLFRNASNLITYSASMTFDASSAQCQRIVVTNGTAMTINAPTNPGVGQTLTVDVLNSSGGAMGAITWNAAFKLAGSFTNPASTKHRTITFYYDGTSWIETARAAADI